MSETTRPKDTRMTVCDLCDEEIRKDQPGEWGSLTHGWIARPVQMPRTKWAFLHWPPASRRISWHDQQKPENQERTYDFHADCIHKLVKDAIEARRLPTRKATT